MEVWAVAMTTCHVHESVGGAQRVDEFRMCHPALVLDFDRNPLGQRGTWARTAMPVRGFVGTHHSTPS